MSGKRNSNEAEPGTGDVLRTGIQMGFGTVIVVLTAVVVLAIPVMLIWAFFDSLF
jgi:hypothetical protein